MRRSLLFISLVILLMACAEKKGEETTVSKTSVQVVVSDTETAKKDTSLDVVSYDVAIASYNFEDLEKTFFQKNDGITYVVNFWATWCKPCVKELPAFEELNSAYKDKNVKVVLASLDFPDKLESHVIPFVGKRNLKSEVVLFDDPNANEWIPKISDQWSGAIPATLVVKNGERKFYERSFTYEELEKELKTIL